MPGLQIFNRIYIYTSIICRKKESPSGSSHEMLLRKLAIHALEHYL
jgi:hypothetical protein